MALFLILAPFATFATLMMLTTAKISLLASAAVAFGLVGTRSRDADAGIVVTDYLDRAEGIMVEAGPAVAKFERVILKPRVTLAAGGHLVDMGTDFDDFSPRATAYATEGVSAQQQANRALLRNAMAAGGLAVYSGEWWHFDGPGAGTPRPILDVPVD